MAYEDVAPMIVDVTDAMSFKDLTVVRAEQRQVLVCTSTISVNSAAEVDSLPRKWIRVERVLFAQIKILGRTCSSILRWERLS